METSMTGGTHLAERVEKVRTLPVQGNTPSDLLRLVIQQGGGIDMVKVMMELQERWERSESHKAYVAALAAFKEEAPTISKDKLVSFPTKTGGRTEYVHATIGNVTAVLVPGLARHGFSHDWSVEQPDNGQIIVSCTLTHKQGYSKTVTMRGSRDESGQKNSIQQVVSAVTYLKRQTLLSVSGFATSDQVDDDGRGFSTETSRDLPSYGSQKPEPTPTNPPKAEVKPIYPDAKFEENLPKWTALITSGKKTASGVIATVESQNTLTDEQKKKINNIEVQS